MSWGIEATIDEAEALGATTVEFSTPASVLVENFLGLPVESPIPMGYYERGKGHWQKQEPGRVIETLGITGDEADVDTDGDGEADDGAALKTLHILHGTRREPLGAMNRASASGTSRSSIFRRSLPTSRRRPIRQQKHRPLRQPACDPSMSRHATDRFWSRRRWFRRCREVAARTPWRRKSASISRASRSGDRLRNGSVESAQAATTLKFTRISLEPPRWDVKRAVARRQASGHIEVTLVFRGAPQVHRDCCVANKHRR